MLCIVQNLHVTEREAGMHQSKSALSSNFLSVSRRVTVQRTGYKVLISVPCIKKRTMGIEPCFLRTIDLHRALFSLIVGCRFRRCDVQSTEQIGKQPNQTTNRYQQTLKPCSIHKHYKSNSKWYACHHLDNNNCLNKASSYQEKDNILTMSVGIMHFN